MFINLYIMGKVVLKGFYCLGILFSALQLTGCSGAEITPEEETPTPTPDEITVSQESLSYFTEGMEFGADADNRTVYFSSNCDWKVEVATND